MSGFCTIHQMQMQERESKTKFADDGSPKTYFGHMVDSKMCFGESIRKSQTNGRSYSHEVTPAVKEEVNWEAKDRQSMAQTAMKSASEIVAAQIHAGDVQAQTYSERAVKEMANEFYKELKSMKNEG